MSGPTGRRRDISLPLFEGMPTFPGDPPFAAESVPRRTDGAPYRLSRLTMGSHTGTHVDPPRHFREDGLAADALDLELLNGPCWVVDTGASTDPVGAGALAAVPVDAVRVLLKTANSARWARGLAYFEEFVGLGTDGAAELLARGVRLVGIDALSIERDPTERYPVHRALLDRGVVILEGLLLAGIRPGPYRLECLPLRLRGGDGAPARAVLVDEEGPPGPYPRSSGGSRSGIPSSIG